MGEPSQPSSFVLKQQREKLAKILREAQRKLNKEQRNINFEEALKFRQELRLFSEVESKNLDKVISALEQQEEFLLNQNKLREFVTQGKGFIPTAQRANIFSFIGGAQFGRPEIAIPSAINVGILSPKAATLVSKPFLEFGGSVTDKVKKTIQNETLQKLISASAARNQQ